MSITADQKTEMIEKIEWQEAELNDKKGDFLRKFGWKERCKNPASIWLWEKEIEGRVIAVSLSTAFLIEVAQ